ncbi:hypothetical protein Salat_2117000 [Sesamum alatum]|uniref:Transposase MuDR plant domain-containing protein n=1 Tax=Sesamum alatum TaxID=300844 RepID=A0AAE1Y1U4_9LAMI|nr:hypothetical protein Salat_2117000 [Sesamum alatum]
MHHGGEFIEEPKKLYVGGEVDYIDFCEGDNMSLSLIVSLRKLIGYRCPLVFNYLIPGCNMNTGLVFLLTEQDIRRMVELAVSNRVIEVFAVESGLEGENIEGEDSEIGIEGDELIESSEEEREDNLVDSEYGLSEDDCENLQQGPMRILEHDNVNMLDEMNISDGEQLEDCESDELNSIPSDDEVESEHVKFYRFRPEIDLPDPQLRNGMIFTDAAQFKEAVKAHAVTWQRNIKFVKNDKIRVRAKCEGVNCPWVVLASKMRNSDAFQIKTINSTHSCGRTLSRHRFVTSKMLSKKYMNDWRLNSGWKLGDFQEKVQNDLNVEVNKSQFYRTKNKVNDMIYGKYKDQYTRLYDYCDELRVSNPGSTVVLKTEVDEDTETEDKNSWGWFLEKLQQDVGMYEHNKWTIISDMQKGLLPAVYDLFPEVDANVPASASQGLTTNPPNTSAFTRANEPVMSPTPLSVKEPEARMGVGGVTLKSNFKKVGKEHVTLTSLQAVTRSRAQSTQQSSNAM